MKERFEGDEGRRRLCEALRDQQLLGCDGALIDAVASALELRDVGRGEEIIVQGAPGGELFFILMGAGFEILVDGRGVAAREAGDVVGEMSAIEPAGLRSATARAVGDTVIGKLDGDAFMRLADAHPRTIYRAIARIVSSRLRERSKFLRPRATRPRLFLGSSVEGLPVADAVRLAFDHGPAEIVLWSDAGSVFKPSRTPIEDLSAAVDAFDFAAFVVTPDDILKIRPGTSAAEELSAARDNLWFEFGLFLGGIGRERVFGLTPRGLKMRRPTDLAGVTLLEYEQPAPGASPNVGVACVQIKGRINQLNAR